MLMPQSLHGNALWESLYALGVIAVSVLASQVVVVIFDRVLRVRTRKTQTTLDDLIVAALRKPIFLLVLVQGVFIALTALTFLDKYQANINQGGLIASLAVVVYAIQKIVGALITWYGRVGASKTPSHLDDRLLPILKRIVTFVIHSIAFLIILNELGISISPILASIGIGGLAVALALQPTLTNFIAAGYLVSEDGLGAGHYVQIEGGPSGHIQDIGWRTTKLRTLQNNLVLLPNSKMADSIITNFTAPSPDMWIPVACGVSYESDLEQVRRVALEVAQGVITDISGAMKDAEPSVLFNAFADSNVTFQVGVRAQDFSAQYTLKDALISRLHARFAKDGIEINYPVRKLLYPLTPPTTSAGPGQN